MTSRSNAHPDPRGFTLVEILVAMVIGMIGMIIMLQVFATAEGQRRATTGTGDAQTSGAMALYDMQRDIRQSGYGFNSLTLLNCSISLPNGATLPALAPVIINPRRANNSLLLPAGDANTDTLLVAYGNAAGSPEGDAITLVEDLQLGLQSTLNIADGHRVIAGPPIETAGCALTLDTAHVSGLPPGRVNVTAGGAVVGGRIFNLGAAPTIQAYAIREGNLTVCDYLLDDCSSPDIRDIAAFWVPIANNIVSLRAQYGRQAAGVVTWGRAAPANPGDWVGVSALRLAVVARNSQLERDPVTLAAPRWEGSNQPAPAGAPFNLSARGNWQNYRYKVFETVVPIRNLPWMAR